MQSLDCADYVALDLDPMPGVPFQQVLDVARWVHDELESLGVPAFPKTSGSSGLHVYIPLPRDTPYESGLLLCQIRRDAGRDRSIRGRRPWSASVGKRGRTVYVDYLQNIEGKTLATAYSARASEFAGVSTPLTWDEIHEGVEPAEFTIRTALSRFEQLADLGRRCSKVRPSTSTACWSGWPATPRVDRSRLGRHCDWSARPGSRAAARLAGM